MRFLSGLLALGFLLSTAGAQSREAGNQSQGASMPARIALEQMGLTERRNARISVEFESSDSEAIAMGHEVERLWNGGQYDEALAQLGSLETRVGHVAIGNSWRRPVPTDETALWGRDVRIGNRDLIMGLTCVADDSVGNLFAAVRRDGPPHWSVCVSTDGGAGWYETFTWVGSPPTSIDAAAFLGHFYVAYNSPAENAQQVRVRRFLCSDGSADTFRTRRMWIVACALDTGDTMREVSLACDRDNEVLYLYALASDGSVLLSSAYRNGSSWSQGFGIGSGAGSGLDGTENKGYSSIFTFFSYYDTSDTLRIYRYTFVGEPGLRCARGTGRGPPASMAAYRDTIVCAFEDETSSPHQVRYAIGFTEGDTWAVGTLSNVDTAAEFPAVMAVGGGDFAAVYRQADSTPGLRFRQRTDGGPWSDPVPINEYEPYNGRPEIVYLGSGVHGVAYLSDTSPVVRGAYFGRSDWVYGITERRRPQASRRTALATVVRGALSLPRDMTALSDRGRGGQFRRGNSDRVPMPILLDISGRKVLDLRPGANDVRTLAPGVYFVREARGPALAQAVRKIVIAR